MTLYALRLVSIVCLDLLEDRRKFMLKVLDKGLDTDEYVYILPDYVGDENRTQIWIDYTSPPDGRNEDARKAFQKALVVMLSCHINTQRAQKVSH